MIWPKTSKTLALSFWKLRPSGLVTFLARHRFRSLTLSIFLACWDVRWTVSGSPDKLPTTWRVLPPSTGCIAGRIDAGICWVMFTGWALLGGQMAARCCKVQHPTSLRHHFGDFMRSCGWNWCGLQAPRICIGLWQPSQTQTTRMDHPQEMTIVTIVTIYVTIVVTFIQLEWTKQTVFFSGTNWSFTVL